MNIRDMIGFVYKNFTSARGKHACEAICTRVPKLNSNSTQKKNSGTVSNFIQHNK